MSRCSLHLVVVLIALAGPARQAAAEDVPPNGWVVWESNRADGRREVYVMKADGTGVTRLTQSGARVPRWSPDGRWIAYQDIVDVSTHLIRWDGSEHKRLFEGTPYFWMHDNSGLVCRGANGSDDFFLVDPETGEKKLLFKQSEFTRLAGKMMEPGGITADGRWMVAGSDRYRGGFQGDNGDFTAGFAAVVLDLRAKDRVYFFGSGCGPYAAPVGGKLYHVCGDPLFCSSKPDIYSMDVADLGSRTSYLPEMDHLDSDWGHEYFPKISNDNQWLVYGASQGCHDQETCDYEIFIHRLGSGRASRTRLTDDRLNDQYPSIHIGDRWKPPQSEPQLSLSPDRLTFEIHTGRDEKLPPQVVMAKNLGGGTLDQVGTRLTYADGTDWLVTIPGGTGNAQKIEVSVKPAGLSAGQHRATLEVTAGSAKGSPAPCEIVVSVDGADPVPATPPSSGCALGAGPGRPFLPLGLTLSLVLVLVLVRSRGAAARAGDRRR